MNIHREGNIYKVESASKKGRFYTVDVAQRTCDCPAFRFRYQKRGLLCKHLEAAIDYDEEFGHERYQKVIDLVRKEGPINTVTILEMFDEDTVNELIQKGELIEERGKLRILD
ncbi:MAG: SWIM zinc finger family protein [DPANN group archaeon]|nr:SWIM zinc finger family protein [DPANN group archaeon]